MPPTPVVTRFLIYKFVELVVTFHQSPRLSTVLTREKSPASRNKILTPIRRHPGRIHRDASIVDVEAPVDCAAGRRTRNDGAWDLDSATVGMNDRFDHSKAEPLLVEAESKP